MFLWDDVPLKGLVHHLFSKHKLVEPVVISLKKADCLHLIYVNNPEHLLKKNHESISPAGKGMPVEVASVVSLAACIAKRYRS
jgi:hypothetical protein